MTTIRSRWSLWRRRRGRRVGPRASSGRYYLNGRIDDGAAERFRDELARREIPSATVYLNSRGGDLAQGMELGRLIRERGFSTQRRQAERAGIDSTCRRVLQRLCICFHRRHLPILRASLAHRRASILDNVAGGYRCRFRANRVGCHRELHPEMEVDVGLFDRMSRAGKDEMLVLSKADLERLRVINNGRLPAEWTIESMRWGDLPERRAANVARCGRDTVVVQRGSGRFSRAFRRGRERRGGSRFREAALDSLRRRLRSACRPSAANQRSGRARHRRSSFSSREQITRLAGILLGGLRSAPGISRTYSPVSASTRRAPPRQKSAVFSRTAKIS